MDENRGKQRPRNRSRVIFVITKAFGVARLGEHDVSRGHDSGVLMVKDSGSGFQLKTGTLSQPGRTDNLRSYPIPGSNVIAVAEVAPSFPVNAAYPRGLPFVIPTGAKRSVPLLRDCYS